MKEITILEKEKYKDLGDLYGLFFEDINHAADGGLYAELVQNRAFEYCEIDNKDYNSFTAWEKSQGLEWSVTTEDPAHENNPHSLIVSGQSKDYFKNLGYGSGINLKQGEKYLLKLRAKSIEGSGKLAIKLADKASKPLTEAVLLTVTSKAWQELSAEIVAKESCKDSELIIELEDKEKVAFDYISLFPAKTFNGRANGLRPDLAEALKEMKPKFLRFPGGCLVHDGNLDASARNSMYRWKNTIGPVYDRPSRRNNWGYNQSLGLGYYEYFVLCEDLGTEPLPVLPAGFNPHKGEGCAMEELGLWVQEALDLIEFANGDVTTVWGKKRAELGHEKPFNLKYLAVGNEEIGDGFFERYPAFHKAIREKYPDILIINSAGPFAVGEGNEAGWKSAVKYGSDLVDEHYYSAPEWFLANMHHYEDYDANGPKVFLGEYATWGNTYYNALVEAAYMVGLEKAKSVALACYAPLFCNVAYKNWTPDMIFFDGRDMVKTANYHVQKMFMANQGQQEVQVKTSGLDEVIDLFDNDGIYGNFEIGANDTKGTISNVKITDTATGAVLCEKDTVELVDNSFHNIADIKAKSYTIEFEYDRSEGRKGLNIHMGKSQDKFLVWEFGGWDNWDCNITMFVNGRASTLSHHIFHVQDIHYKLKIQVEGRKLTTFVNGELKNSITMPQPEIEELYTCASVDQDGSMYIKVVNLTGEAKNVQVNVEGDKQYKKAAITSLKDQKLTDENTLEQPKVVLPKEDELKITGNSINYEFPAHSLTVFKCN